MIRFLEIFGKPQTVVVPRGRMSAAAGEVRLHLVSTLSPLWVSVEVTPAEVEFFGDYAAASVMLPREVTKGEWKYTFTVGGIVISEGIAIVGGMPAPESPVKPTDGGISVQYDPMK